MEKHQKLLPGQLDPSFGGGGYVLYPEGNESFLGDFRLFPDGKILAASYSGNALWLARFSADGVLDESFGDGGKLFTAIPNAIIIDMLSFAVQKSRDRIVCVIRFNSLAGIIGEVMLIGLLPDGSIDPSFGNEGLTLLPTEADQNRFQEFQLAVGDDAITLGLKEERRKTLYAAVASLTADGEIRTDFGGGVVRFGAYQEQLHAVPGPDGKVLTVGAKQVGTEFILTQFNQDGTLDMNFGVNGIFNYRVTSEYTMLHINGVALKSDGKVVVAGSLFAGADRSAVLLQVTEDGQLDESFNGGEPLFIRYDGNVSRNFDVTVQEDGRIILLSGSSDKPVVVARILSSGAFDPSFGNNGFMWVDRGLQGYSLALQSDGKILLSAMEIAGYLKLLIIRLTAD